MLPGTYRVSRKTGNAFVFWISRLPRGLKISSWTFFNSPFHVDFKNIRDFIIWLKLDQDIVKILQGTLLKSWHFLFCNESSTRALWITHQHSWALLRVHWHSWVLMGTHELSWEFRMNPWAIMSTHEHSLAFMTMTMVPWHHESSWVLLALCSHAHEYSQATMSTLLMAAHDHPRAAMSTHGHSWAFMSMLT